MRIVSPVSIQSRVNRDLFSLTRIQYNRSGTTQKTSTIIIEWGYFLNSRKYKNLNFLQKHGLFFKLRNVILCAATSEFCTVYYHNVYICIVTGEIAV